MAHISLEATTIRRFSGLTQRWILLLVLIRNLQPLIQHFPLLLINQSL